MRAIDDRDFVIIRRNCARCSGTGSQWGAGGAPCGVCNGVGVTERSVTLPQLVQLVGAWLASRWPDTRCTAPHRLDFHVAGSQLRETITIEACCTSAARGCIERLHPDAVIAAGPVRLAGDVDDHAIDAVADRHDCPFGGAHWG